MATVVSFENYMPVPRHDGVPWNRALIEESSNDVGPWTLIATIVFADLDVDPATPKPRSFTTNAATLDEGWYRVTFEDASNNRSLPTAPLHNSTTEILASLDDINGNLDGMVVVADWQNTALLQISVARMVRGYLSRVIDNAVLLSWSMPDATPSIIREVAGKLIAAQLYFTRTARESLEIPPENYSQILYNQAMAILNDIIAGTILVDNTVIVSTESMSLLDFWPIDDTDRAFTLSKRLYGQNA